MYLGIDLGTTNSVAIIFNDTTNEVEPVTIDGADEIIPSAVNFLEDTTIVGSEAKSGAIIYPETTILSIKRLMGHHDAIVLGDTQKLPQEISAEILKKLKHGAQEQANCTFDEVVITHPAYFNDKQIYATQQAGYLAGFKTVFLLSEPLAAAIEYGYKNPQAQTILVYDLGGGTFDASVLKVSVDEYGQELFQELASLGDMNLGGDDFDQELIRYFKKSFKKEHGIDIDELEDDLERKRVIQKLKLEAENTKKKLSSVNKVTVSINPLLIEENLPKNLNLEITKEDFEAIIRKYVDRTSEIIEETLKRAKREPDQISKVILVGGSTLVPMVKRTVAGLVKEPYRSGDPAKSVAMGAAIYNYLIHLPGSNVKVQQITRQVLGTMAIVDTGTMERELIPIIPMGSPIPVSISDANFSNMVGSTAVDVNIYQWESGYEEQRQYIGCVSLSNLKSLSRLELTYNIDENNLFEVHVKDVATGVTEKSAFDRTAIEEEPELADVSTIQSNVNVVFIIDTTGSMDNYITGVKDRAISFSKILSEKNVDFKLGLIGFGDLNEGEKPTVYDFTTDVEKFSQKVKKIPRTYGGDIPESSLDALETGALRLAEKDVSNIFILITDAPPHIPTKSGKTVQDIQQLLEDSNVTTYIVARQDKASLEGYQALVEKTGKYYSMRDEFYDILDNIAISITELVRTR
ncbi:MAG: Hsp70 family protein [Defluviitaleaceae bacterium]|nr:Hsp70 family protein [Defluviitaleaceae bacterium]